MRELIISGNDSGQRLNKYLLKYLNNAPSSFVYKMLRKKNITLNGKKAAGDEILEDKDIVKLFLSEDTIEKLKKQGDVYSDEKSKNSKINKKQGQELQILYKTNDMIAVHKPVGILSQKASFDDYSINEMIVDYCMQNGLYTNDTTFTPSVCNRLDRNTSGIIMAGTSLKGSQYLSEIIRNGKIEKYYFALVDGLIDKDIEQKAYIKKDNDKNISVVINADVSDSINNKRSGYDYIETHFMPLSSNGRYTLLKIHLITGKSHQIRAGLKELGYPIAGDYKYGNSEVNRYFRNKYGLKSQFLHAGQLILPDGTIITDPLPKLFKNICSGEHLNYKLTG